MKRASECRKPEHRQLKISFKLPSSQRIDKNDKLERRSSSGCRAPTKPASTRKVTTRNCHWLARRDFKRKKPRANQTRTANDSARTAVSCGLINTWLQEVLQLKKSHCRSGDRRVEMRDRKSTRLNSSHSSVSRMPSSA